MLLFGGDFFKLKNLAASLLTVPCNISVEVTCVSNDSDVYF